MPLLKMPESLEHVIDVPPAALALACGCRLDPVPIASPELFDLVAGQHLNPGLERLERLLCQVDVLAVELRMRPLTAPLLSAVPLTPTGIHPCCRRDAFATFI